MLPLLFNIFSLFLTPSSVCFISLNPCLPEGCLVNLSLVCLSECLCALTKMMFCLCLFEQPRKHPIGKGMMAAYREKSETKFDIFIKRQPHTVFSVLEDVYKTAFSLLFFLSLSNDYQSTCAFILSRGMEECII